MKNENLNEFLPPREKLIKYGAKSLSDIELLAILLDTGTKEYSVLELSKNIIDKYGFERLFKMEYKEISKIKGIKEAKGCKLLSTFEITRRIIEMETSDIKLKSSKDIFDYIYKDYYMLDYEMLSVIYVDNKYIPIKKTKFTNKNIDKVDLPFKEILKEALNLNAFGIMLVHNHPQGSLTPSRADIKMTERISMVLSEIDIHFFDHLIIAKGKYYSFADSLLKE